MAGDLIPPPSPAGRPEPEGLREDTPPGTLWADADHPPVEDPRPSEARDEQPEPERRREPDYRSRFGFITGALAGIGMAAVVVTVLIVFGGGVEERHTAGDWSSWRPQSEDRFGAAAEIAAHVGARYRLDDGGQLVSIDAGPIAFRDVEAEVLLKTAATGGDVLQIEGDGILYTFNGLGPNGSVATGEVTEARGALVRREALEVALHTFRHIPETDHVVMVMPPPRELPAGVATGPTGATGAAQTPTRVLFMRPGDLRAQLEAPLELTMGSGAPPRPATIPRREVDGLLNLMRPHEFDATFQQTADGSLYLVLTRPQAQATAGAGTAPAATPTPTATPRKRR